VTSTLEGISPLHPFDLEVDGPFGPLDLFAEEFDYSLWTEPTASCSCTLSTVLCDCLETLSTIYCYSAEPETLREGRG
jgi:hypothetical protein